MSKNQIIKLSSTVTMLATIFLIPIGSFAQSGSRLCGWVATTATGQTIGMLYEGRTTDSSFEKNCKQSITDLENAIKKDPTLAPLSWKKIHKSTCDSVGQQFVSTSNPKPDMCDYMTGRDSFKVIKESAAVTTYLKLQAY